VQKTFAERFPETLALHAQRTHRLTTTLTLFALVLSGRAGERLLAQIGMSTSADTLVRLAKRAESPSNDVPEVLGVDDFAFRRGKTYGTILVDLKTNRPIDLLPERTGDALANWLRQPPGVKLISRDRSSEYARGASEGAPQAQQIVDRLGVWAWAQKSGGGRAAGCGADACGAQTAPDCLWCSSASALQKAAQ
jgi:transposase